MVHRDRRWFEEPEAFRPERWEGDFVQRLPRFAYFPFGGGPRQCIGKGLALMEAQLILVLVAQRFRLRHTSGHQVEPQALLTLRPRGGLPMFVEPV